MDHLEGVPQGFRGLLRYYMIESCYIIIIIIVISMIVIII